MTGASAGVVPALATPRWLDSVPVVIAVAVVVIDVGLRLAVLGIIPSNRKPSSAMAWLLLILLIPLPGFALFLLLGSTRVGRRAARAAGARSTTRIRAATADVGRRPRRRPARSYLGSVATLNRNLGALPLPGGNSVELLPDYRRSIAAMAADVDAARRLRARGVLHHRLGRGDRARSSRRWSRATERGVTVRLLFDHLGSRGIPGYQDVLEAARRHRDRVAPDAADPAAQGRVPAPRPAQPPQDPGRRRPGRRSPARRT